MALYHYTAMSGSGNTIRGTLEADSIASFYVKLKQQNLYCLKVNEDTGAPFLLRLIGRTTLPLKELAVFLRQLASMISAGVTIDNAIELVYGQCGNGRMKTALSRLYKEVQKGCQLSSAMGETGGAFGTLTVNMIRAGESSGTLDNALLRLADYYEREIKIRNKTMLAMLYPIILSVVAIIVILILFVVVLPSFITIFQSVESLPWYTRVLIAVSDFTVNRWYALAAVVAGAVLGISALSKNDAFMFSLDEKILRLPFIGRLQIQIITARFCRVFGSLYSSGVYILEALKLSGDVLANRRVKLALEKVSDEVRRGVSLSAAIRNQEIFPEMMVSMLMVGEESGSIDDMLTKISDYYDEEADFAIQRILGLLQPVMIIFLGIVIAFIMVAVLKPIYGMYQNI